jgi:ABC-type branched-subunit amino acid transport system substrate-binding protein
VLNACVAEHNAGPAPVRGRKRLSESVTLSEQPKWNLHIWELQGRPETWPGQLAEFARQKPVFAMVGGVGGGNWAPVHAYCERAELPCVFPSVEVPVADEAGFYPLYLSRGVLLEAAIVARHIGEQAAAVKRVVQVLRSDDEAARAAAAALRRQLAAQGIATEERRLETAAAIDARTFDDAAPADALVLWLRAADLRRLGAITPVPDSVYLSATLGDAEPGLLRAAWKARALIASPYELPQNREARTALLHAWLEAQKLDPLGDPAQTDAYIACSAFSAGMNAIAGHLRRDYLVERLEVITGRGGYSGHYSVLSLGAGQRFASKSGYLVRFAGPEQAGVVAVGERMAP